VARNDTTGEIPSQQQEWALVQDALRLATRIAETTAQAVRPLGPAVAQRTPIVDPRLVPALPRQQATVLRYLQIQFRVSNPGFLEVMNVADGFQRIQQRLSSLRRDSFRMVTQAVTNAESGRAGGDTFGYVMPEQPDFIFLNDTYFSLGVVRAQPAPRPQPHPSGPRRAVVTPVLEEVRVLQDLPTRAGVVLLETVHLVMGADGAVHRAVRYGTTTSSGSGDVPFPEVHTYLQALGDAYVWERFARAVFALQP
jgi:hypothetical protein